MTDFVRYSSFLLESVFQQTLINRLLYTQSTGLSTVLVLQLLGSQINPLMEFIFDDLFLSDKDSHCHISFGPYELQSTESE